jgi:hypothetical protein
MGAHYSFYVKSIATCAPTFFMYIISVLASLWHNGVSPFWSRIWISKKHSWFMISDFKKYLIPLRICVFKGQELKRGVTRTWTFDHGQSLTLLMLVIMSLTSKVVQCTKVHFFSFFSGGFITDIVVNPPERKLAKRTSVQCTKVCFEKA